MGVKRRFFWFSLAFIGILLLFLASIPQHMGVMAQEYEPESEGERIDLSQDTLNSSQDRINQSQDETNSSQDNSVGIKSADILGNMTPGEITAGKRLEVTIYEQGLALVKERREINLESGVNQVEYSDIASEINPASVIVEDRENRDTAILEQDYEYDLTNNSSLLEKYFGREIAVTGRDGETYNGTLLSYDGNTAVLRTGAEKVVVIRNISKIELADSFGLSVKPALIWKISSPVAGTREFLVSYLTGGISWNADYVLISNENDTEADIQGRVNIDNKAGLTYENASLRLVSGEMNRISSQPQPLSGRAEEAAVQETKSSAPFTEEALYEYHLYSLERPATLINNQEKQISLFSVESVPVKKELVYDSSRGEEVWVFLTLKNSNKTGLGRPLPEGVVRVYKTDYAGELQFLGEDRIGHTPKDEELKIATGSAFDLAVKRNQTDYQRISDNVERVSYEIQVNNSKSEAQNMTVVEHLFGEWEVLESSDPYEKTAAFKMEFKVAIPGNGTKIISYTVERRY